jgi:predicted nuclease with TOPRIM domain
MSQNHSSEVRDLQMENDNLQSSLKKSKNDVNHLEKQVEELNDSRRELEKVKLEKDTLNFKVKELLTDTFFYME